MTEELRTSYRSSTDDSHLMIHISRSFREYISRNCAVYEYTFPYDGMDLHLALRRQILDKLLQRQARNQMKI